MVPCQCLGVEGPELQNPVARARLDRAESEGYLSSSDSRRRRERSRALALPKCGYRLACFSSRVPPLGRALWSLISQRQEPRQEVGKAGMWSPGSEQQLPRGNALFRLRGPEAAPHPLQSSLRRPGQGGCRSGSLRGRPHGEGGHKAPRGRSGSAGDAGLEAQPPEARANCAELLQRSGCGARVPAAAAHLSAAGGGRHRATGARGHGHVLPAGLARSDAPGPRGPPAGTRAPRAHTHSRARTPAAPPPAAPRPPARHATPPRRRSSSSYWLPAA